MSLWPPRSTARVSSERATGQVAGVIGGHTLVNQGFDLALAFRDEAARAIDIGLGAGVAAVEKRDPGPDVDGVIEAAGEILVEAGEQQLLDAALALGGLAISREVARRAVRHLARAIGHSVAIGCRRCDYRATAQIGQ